METQKQKERKEKRESKLLKKLTFDEALTPLLSREAMSKKNVGVMKIFTELSKGHGRMIFCAQNPKVDSSLKDPAFLRATFTKETKKHMSVASDLFPLDFYDIPRSPIKFDKDRLAEFSEVEAVTYSDLSMEYKTALLYKQGYSFGKIEKELGIPRMTVKRNIMKVLGAWLKSQSLQVLEKEATVGEGMMEKNHAL